MTAAVYVGRHRAYDPDETVQLPPVWPTEDPEDLTEGQFVGELAVSPWRRLVRRLAAVRWSGTRVTMTSLSAAVFGAVGSGALWTVIR